MPYGKIGFEHVWKYQIGCMMANQYTSLVNAIHDKKPENVIVACLRLGWNDAFKHVSENTQTFNSLSDKVKDSQVNAACEKLVKFFTDYASQKNSKDRFDKINDFLKRTAFLGIFSSIKNIHSSKYPLCLGHIQKMFNIAIKLLVCLIISAEHSAACGITVKLGEVKRTAVHLTDCDKTGRRLLSYDNFPYEFDTADCPIDHIILTSIKNRKTSTSTSSPIGHKEYDEIVWSKMGGKEDPENYLVAQSEIGAIQAGSGKSNLCFDFENWK